LLLGPAGDGCSKEEVDEQLTELLGIGRLGKVGGLCRCHTNHGW
jgi:hypothetical protein